ncbi:ferric reductase-like transmembrane domain-containing protein [uncultured Roseobacter sp.]|uniref:ferric reductase-like transmembrane domain-containing protein n=1 Tax=uncultured Roseobacter sp. TaxID=114847 RepID=UPI00261A60BC|nr:ferric reductase-like transmembrane domain-containing protein [uncultured Roseobacter sp.]
MNVFRTAFPWLVLAAVIFVPIGAAVASPLLAWRDPVYIIAGFAGIFSLALLLVQPLLIGGDLPGLKAMRGRLGHRLTGACVIIAVLIHVGGLWITSPPDVIDALLFASPTPFSAWGVVAMWALFATGVLAVLRRRAGIRPRIWRIIHLSLVIVIVAGTLAHALLIEGAMEPWTRLVLCLAVLLAVVRALIRFGLPALRALLND